MRSTRKKLIISTVLILLLAVCFCVATIAIAISMARVENNEYGTGVVKINLNDGEPVITQDEFIFEPGMTVNKDFFLQNQSSCDVYYRIYFQNVEGGLKDVLQVSITSEGELLFSGTPNQLSKKNVMISDAELKIDETKDMQISFYFPKEAGNEAQDMSLSFDLAADAVQTKNNTNKEFE